MNKKYIPVVSQETAHALRASYSQDNNYTENILADLRENNPKLAEFIAGMAVKSRDPKYVAETSILVLKLIENQAEANELNGK
jgi:hypothetical protein